MPALPFSHEMFFAGLGIFVSLIRYATYLWSIYKMETRPHVFSWLNWSLMVGIGAYAQFKLGGGPSVWILMLVSFTCFFISILALFVGEKNITRSDWYAFIGAIIAIVLWRLSQSPFAALVCLILVDSLSYYPTIRKSWNDPWGEPPVSYLWSGSRYFFALFAVPNPEISSLTYPFFLMITDWAFAFYIFIRRRVLEKRRAA